MKNTKAREKRIKLRIPVSRPAKATPLAADSKTLALWDIGYTPSRSSSGTPRFQTFASATLLRLDVGIPVSAAIGPGTSSHCNLVKETVLGNPVHPTIDWKVNTGGGDRGIY